MLSQWCQPETGGAQLVGVYAREFVRQGHQVRVLTGFPNYPEGVLYPGYKMRARARDWDGAVRIDRVALYPNHDASAVGRFLNYMSFGLSATTLGAGSLRGADAIWVFNHPITVSLPLLTHSRMGRIPIFLHVQDLWPDSLLESGMFPDGRVADYASKIISSLVRFTERKSAIIGVISPSVRELILERNPALDPSKIVYAPNPANEQLIAPVSHLREEIRSGGEREFTEFMYAGAIGHVQGLDTLVDAAKITLQARSDIRFTLVGDGVSRDRLERRVVDEGISNVRFTGRVPERDVPLLLARADVQIVSLGQGSLASYTMPSKIASLLAAGVPILGHISGDGASVLQNSKAAIVAESGDADRLADAAMRFADMDESQRGAMGRDGHSYYQQYLSAARTASNITNALLGAQRATK